MNTLLIPAAVFFRCLGLVSLLPLGAGNEALLRKFTIAGAVTFLLLEAVPAAPAAGNPSGFAFEYLIGLFLSLPAVVCLELAAMFGELFEWGRGQTIGNLFDPLCDISITAMAGAVRSLIWVLLLIGGGLEVLLQGLVDSFGAVPPLAVQTGTIVHAGQQSVMLVIRQLGLLLQLYLPLAILFFLADLAAGFLARLMPRANLANEVFLLRSALGLIALFWYCDLDIAGSLPRLIKPQILSGG